MGEFRDALNVDCNYCHGGGRTQEVDINPRKDIARKMIMLVRQINTNFPGTGVFPVGNQAVTCYTCHRGDPHPAALRVAGPREVSLRLRWALALGFMGDRFAADGNLSDAMTAYQRALDVTPASARLALSLAISGDRNEALATLAPLVAQRDSAAGRTRVWLEAGDPLQHRS